MKVRFSYAFAARFAAHRVLLFGSLLACLLPTAILASLPDYDNLDEILARNVRNGFVDYDGIAAEPGFAEFVAQLGTTRKSDLVSPDDELAFYINAYNVLSIQGVLNGKSPTSWWGRRQFFRKQEFRVLGEMMTLDTIEHERIGLRGEPRVHFAIVCASISCPRLASRAYRSDTLNEQLHEATKRFVNDRTRNRFDTGRKKAFLSKIFEWYEDDFVTAGGTLQRYLARFVTNAEIEDTLRRNEFDVRFVAYDWHLNGHFADKD